MTNAKNNQEDDEIRKSRVWKGYAMNGKWDGNGTWHKDKQWKGNGTWEGGLISGTWNGNGEWEPVDDGNGEWKIDGEFKCNIPFAKNIETLVAVIGIILSIVFAALNLVIGVFGWITTIIIIVVIALLSIVSVVIVKKTTNGKLHGTGKWIDVGEFRILDMIGEWKIGIHERTIQGKMKDPKPR